MTTSPNTLLKRLQSIISPIFVEIGANPDCGRVSISDRPDLGQFQCNGAMAAASQLRKPPRKIAENVVELLSNHPTLANIHIAGPGFINFDLNGEFLAERTGFMLGDEKLGFGGLAEEQTIVLDFGGLNVAKAMHVGHLRSLIIGDSLQRLFRFVGAKVISDVHLGDWGLQMGLLIDELARRAPDLPYFDPDFSGEYPQESPVSLDDLQDLYVTASSRSANSPEDRESAKLATRALQVGRIGYRKLWQHFIAVSHQSLGEDFSHLNISFDLWEGESSVNQDISAMIENLKVNNIATVDQGALIIVVAREDDNKKVPPLLLLKSDGAVLYSTTDLATIKSRVDRFNPDKIIYVVDQRQSLHFEQVFRASDLARFSGNASLEHIGFGTINGSDGKPFKTRAGGTMRLNDLFNLSYQEAMKRLDEGNIAVDFSDEERNDIARKVGIASIKYADLINNRLSDYIFDIKKFTSFEGKTGPYLMYTVARIKSVFRKAEEREIQAGSILAAGTKSETNLMLKLLLFPDMIMSAYDKRAPHVLCEYAFTLAQEFNRFYQECAILSETDVDRRGSYLSLLQATLITLEKVLEMLGLPVLERM